MEGPPHRSFSLLPEVIRSLMGASVALFTLPWGGLGCEKNASALWPPGFKWTGAAFT